MWNRLIYLHLSNCGGELDGNNVLDKGCSYLRRGNWSNLKHLSICKCDVMQRVMGLGRRAALV